MAWTYFPLDPATLPARGLQDWGIWQELIDAINERSMAVTTGIALDGFSNPFPTNADGAAIAQSGLGSMQVRIQQLKPYFLAHPDEPNWHGSAALPTFWGSGGYNIFDPAYANVGDGTSWTRRYGPDPDALLTAYGTIQSGDVCGLYREGGVDKIAEYMNEMYRTLNYMRWTLHGKYYWNIMGYKDGRYQYLSYMSAFFPTSAAARAAVEAVWPGLSWSALTGWTRASYHAKHEASFFQHGSAGTFRATGLTYRTQYRFGGTALGDHPIWTGRSSSADFYWIPTAILAAPYGEWDEDGLGYVQDRYSLVESQGESNANTRETSLFSDTAVLQDAPSSDPGPTEWIRRGWTFGDNCCMVLKWDGPNGFSKIT